MIFWMGFEKRVNFLLQLAYAENILYKKKPHSPNAKFQFVRFMSHIGGYHFLHHIAILEDGFVTIYNKKYLYPTKKNFKFIDKLKIYTDNDDISEMPEHVLVETNKLDFIRELFDVGKKVSWYNPDLNFFASDLSKFNFEHLFIDVFNTNKWIFPTGKTREPFDEFGRPFINYARPFLRVPYDSIIGYWPAILRKRVNKAYYYKKVWRLAKKQGIRAVYDRWCMFSDDYRCYYNMLSISYMLWRRSTAATAIEKSALKG